MNLKLFNKFKSQIRLWVLKIKYGSNIIVESKFSIGSRCVIEVLDNASLRIGNRVCLGDDNSLVCIGGKVSIGKLCWFNRNCHINAYEEIIIGERCLFGPNVGIFDSDHKFSDLSIPIKEQGFITRPISIGSDVWLGANVIVTKGVMIGNHVVVGANSVVTNDLEPFSVYGGNPARLIRKLN